MGDTWQVIGRLVVQSITLVILIIGIVLLGVAIGTPNWRYNHIFQLQQENQFGLWEQCTKGPRNNIIHSSPYDFICEYRQEEWTQPVLILVACGGTLAILALIFGLFASCSRISAYLWTGTTFFASLITAVGVIMFAIRANEMGHRFALAGATENVENHIGSSFWIAVGGTIALFIAAIGSVLTIFLLAAAAHFLADRPNTSYSRVTVTKNTTTRI